MEYIVVVEKTKNGYSAYVPDLPGCIAAADTDGEVRKLIGEAFVSHVDSLRQHGDPLPEPRASVTTFQV